MLRHQLRLSASLGLIVAISASSLADKAPREMLLHADPWCTGQRECLGDGVVKNAVTEVSVDGADKASGPAVIKMSKATESRGAAATSAVSTEETRSTLVVWIGNTKNITVQRAKTITTAEGHAWIGTVKESGERALIMWWKDGRTTGVLSYKGRIYTLANADGEVHAAIEKHPRQTRAHAFASRARSAASNLGDDANPEKTGQPSETTPIVPTVKPLPDAERRALEARKITIDLMILYTKKAVARYLINPADLVALAVEETNQAFRNSGLGNISLRLAHMQSIDYDEANSEHFEHLYHMVDGTGPFGQVRQLRDQKRADIVGMILDDPSGCGLSTRVAADAEEAYFVVHHHCAAVMISIAHEVGHILGARHDRQTDTINSPFPYGHGHVNGKKWRDIMSYQQSCDGCPRIPYWSNPRVTYQGEPTGTVLNDNARVIPNRQSAYRTSGKCLGCRGTSLSLPTVGRW